MYPRSVNLFIPWSKAMVAGATVDKPNYGKMKARSRRQHARRSPRRKKSNRAKKD